MTAHAMIGPLRIFAACLVDLVAMPAATEIVDARRVDLVGVYL